MRGTVRREDPLRSRHGGCSILSALHALDSISFLSACDSSVGGGGGGRWNGRVWKGRRGGGGVGRMGG